MATTTDVSSIHNPTPKVLQSDLTKRRVNRLRRAARRSVDSRAAAAGFRETASGSSSRPFYAPVGYFQYLFFYFMEFYFKDVLGFDQIDHRLYSDDSQSCDGVGMIAGGFLSDALSTRGTTLWPRGSPISGNGRERPVLRAAGVHLMVPPPSSQSPSRWVAREAEGPFLERRSRIGGRPRERTSRDRFFNRGRPTPADAAPY